MSREMQGADRTRPVLGWFLALVALAAVVWPAAAFGATESGTPVAMAPGVPDQGRAWELVTPEDPVGGVVATFHALADDGSRIAYLTLGPLPGAVSGDALSDNLARRAGNGWANSSDVPPYPKKPVISPADGPRFFDANLTASFWLNDVPGLGSAEDPRRGLFREEANGAFTFLGIASTNTSFLGATPDLGQLYVESSDHLLPADAARIVGTSIYEVDDAGLHLFDVDDGGAVLFPCGSEVTEGSGVSSDGSRVFIGPGPACAGQGGVYLREAGTTTEISTAQCGLPDCGDDPDPRFVGATPDGAHAYLIAETRLTTADIDPGADLYRYDVDSGQLTLLTGMAGFTPDVATVTPSPDGAALAFSAISESGGEEGVVILDAHGARFLAMKPGPMEWSADGRFLVFQTSLRLVPGDQDESLDVYRYDVVSGEFTEISAGQGGSGNAALDARISESLGTGFGHRHRTMSADGEHVFFTTAEQLVAEDRNEAADVYEWANGQLGLISSGAGERPATYLDSTPDASTVVFRTTGTLLPRDRDGGDVDYYVARVGGGFPEPPGGPDGDCEGASCRSAGPSPAALKPPTRHPGLVALRRPSNADRARFAASGWLELLAESPGPGKLSARASARLGSRLRTIGSTRLSVSAAGPVRLRLRLSDSARKALRHGATLKVRVTLRLRGHAGSARTFFAIRKQSS
ncbi:MAG: hypothetical protein ABW065_09390 [Solirubrobacterales bacterium]